MILHAASIAAFFLDQLAQAPVAVQCVVPPNADPGWKQWIPTAVSLFSVGIGLWIANRTIRNARELTEWSFRATSEKDHERWVLDQKKAEWQELLRATAHMRRIMSPGLESPQTRAKLIRAGLKPVVQELEVLAANCVFLRDFFTDEIKRKRFYSYLHEADLNVEKIEELYREIQYQKDLHPNLTDQERQCGISQATIEIGNLADKIALKFMDFNDWLCNETVEDLA